jgi:16S rRNA (cytosine967-C5)-methyltransferase
LRRSPDLRFHFDVARLGALATTQLLLLVHASRLIKRGGRLVFAVCSVLDVEGRAHVDAFLERVDDAFGLERTALLAPHVDGTDGFFVAVFRRE